MTNIREKKTVPHILIKADRCKPPCCKKFGLAYFLMPRFDMESLKLGPNAFIICFKHGKVMQIAEGEVTTWESAIFDDKNPRFYEVGNE